MLAIKKPWQITALDVVKFLNSKYPALQESCGLLLRDASTLNLLESLQVAKTEHALMHITMPISFAQQLRAALFTVLFAVVLSVALYAIPLHFGNIKPSTGKPYSPNKPPEKILPGISSTQLEAVPPAYTKLAPYTQQQMNIQVPEGSAVKWLLQTNTAARTLKLVFNDSSAIFLQPTNKQHTAWSARKLVAKSGFYQQVLDGAVSEFYKMEAVKDQPPVIVIQSPKPNTTIEFWEPQRVMVAASLDDDYGLKDAFISATTASGGGEAVKFKEQKITFPNSFAGQLKQYHVQRTIDLSALGMQPGDELYVFVQAEDNNGHITKSDMMVVSLADTTKLSEAEGLVNGVKLKPEYFRSERQIILDAEQLLKDKDTISATDFNNRSNNLGIDQKLLRLRYGKFLGEEQEETEGGVDRGKDNILADPINFGNAAVVLDAFTDKHDNAEDAGFFDAGTKTLLKNTLTEMWNAEALLRTFKPKEALPYAYKALKLLKSLQEQSRVYVAKTTFKTTPLKPEKRLSGELDKIIQPVRQSAIANNPKAAADIALALGVLEQLKASTGLQTTGGKYLQASLQILANKAATEPGAYLQGLQAVKAILAAMQNNQPVAVADISTAEAALQKITSTPAVLPFGQAAPAYNALQQQYLINLHKNSEQ